MCTLHVSKHKGLTSMCSWREAIWRPILTHLIVRLEALCGWERRARLLCQDSRLPAQRHLQGLAILVALQLGALCGALIGSRRLCSLYLRCQEVPLAVLFFLQDKEIKVNRLLTANSATHCLMHMIAMQRMPSLSRCSLRTL